VSSDNRDVTMTEGLQGETRWDHMRFVLFGGWGSSAVRFGKTKGKPWGEVTKKQYAHGMSYRSQMTKRVRNEGEKSGTRRGW